MRLLILSSLVLLVTSNAAENGATTLPVTSNVPQNGAKALPAANELLERSLAYHDPQNAWSSRPIEITAEVRLAVRLAAERGYARRTDRIRVDNAAEQFQYWSEKGADRIEITGDGGTFSARLNGSSEISAEDRQEHRLANDQLPGWRDYFTYVYGMPMKLRDPGTRLDPAVTRTEFAGREVFALRVTYAPEVGTDTWYFYVNPRTFALVGCRFFHDEAKNDGEYIVFEGEIKGPHGLRLPKLRHWHMNRDDEYIAVDEVISIE
jgi:hypothetical protein